MYFECWLLFFIVLVWDVIFGRNTGLSKLLGVRLAVWLRARVLLLLPRVCWYLRRAAWHDQKVLLAIITICCIGEYLLYSTFMTSYVGQVLAERTIVRRWSG